MIDTVRRHFDGLEHFSRSRLEDGSYVDVVVWRSMEHARAAAAGVMEIFEREEGGHVRAARSQGA